MKKLFLVLILSLVLSLATGCTTSLNLDDNEDPNITAYQSYNTQGDYARVVIEEVADGVLIDSSTKLPDSAPIYINKYAFGQEGPLFKIDQELKIQMTNNLSQFLDILYEKSDGKYNIVTHPEVDHQVMYESEELEVWSAATGIVVNSDQYNIGSIITEEDLQSNVLLKAAIGYLGVEKPQIFSTIIYGEDGKPYEYQSVITQHTDDLITAGLNNRISFVKIISYPETNLAQVQICKMDLPEKYGDYTSLSYDTALKYLTTEYPNIDASKTKAQIQYSSAIDPNYFIPCYRFYLGGLVETDGMPQYVVVDIPIVEKNNGNSLE